MTDLLTTDGETAAREAEALFQAGFDLHRQGKLAEAERLYGEVLRRGAENADALHFLGLIAIQSGQPAKAVDLISRAVAIRPDEAAMYCNRAAALSALNRLADAVDDYGRAAAMQPDLVQAHSGRGDALAGLGRYSEALASYERVIALNPGHADAHMGCGNAHRNLGRLDAALISYDRALALNPASVAAYYNRGNLLAQLNRPAAAIASFDGAIALRPDFAMAHQARAVALLQQGRFEEGFTEYEWRKQCPDFQDDRHGLVPALFQEAADLSGKTLFIYPEGFLGDMIQFCRYVPWAQARGAKVVLAAPNRLHSLLRTLGPAVELLAEAETPTRFDYACALMSLPLAFRTTPQTAALQGPYLHAAPALVEHWKARMGEDGVRIGVCWQGSTDAYSVRLKRSFPLAELESLARLAGVRLISLQKNDGLDQLTSLPAGMTVETLGEDFDAGSNAFLDTAAVIAGCDLVITADTSIAHLAGALGARTWVALPFNSEWRWGLDRRDSPWYPTMRLFRQPALDDWRGLFSEIEAALAAELDHA